MVFSIKRTLILIFLLSMCACDLLGFGDSVTVESDPIILDLKEEVDMLQGEITLMDEQDIKVKKYLNTAEDLETEMKMAIKRELFEKIYWEKKIFELLAARKVRLNQRLKLLNSRKKGNTLTKDKIDIESREYFQNKALKPLKKPWDDRYKAAIDI